MNTNIWTTGMDVRAKLSTLWIFVLFNLIFSEFHRLLQPGFLEEVMTGTISGVQMSQEVLLLGAVVLEIPIAMALLSRVLSYRVNRWANIIAGAMTIAIVLFNMSADLDNIFFSTIGVVAMSLIVWYAWRWHKQQA